MKLSEKLLIIASWLESSENDIIVNADDNSVDVVADAFVNVAEILNAAADEVMELEPKLEKSAQVNKDLELAEHLETLAAYEEYLMGSINQTGQTKNKYSIVELKELSNAIRIGKIGNVDVVRSNAVNDIDNMNRICSVINNLKVLISK